MKELTPYVLKVNHFTNYEPRYVHEAFPCTFIDDYHQVLSYRSTRIKHANRVVIDLNKENTVKTIMDSYICYRSRILESETRVS